MFDMGIRVDSDIEKVLDPKRKQQATKISKFKIWSKSDFTIILFVDHEFHFLRVGQVTWDMGIYHFFLK